MGGGVVARVGVRYPTLAVDIALHVDPGEVVALVGANGAGKTTVLRALAGLRPLDEGRIELGGRVVDDPVADVFVPARDRRAGYVFQDYRLFPHLTAAENVAFGLQARGTARREALAVAHGWLDRVGLAALAGLRPGELSGGQGQRVALARALAVEPSLLLLDEPLAAVDAVAAAEVRQLLAAHLDEFRGATVLVTHDLEDAASLADRIVVLDAGRLADTVDGGRRRRDGSGPPATVRP